MRPNASLTPFLFLSTLALAITAPVTHAGTLSLDLSTACIHNKTEARHNLNQLNPGLGMEYQFTPHVGLAGGFYRNSFRRASVYALATWTPLRLTLPAGLTARIGVAGGVVSGYSRVNPFAPFAAAALLAVRNPQGWGINLVAVPNIAASSGFVGLQLVAPL